jgi:hypothetical protein
VSARFLWSIPLLGVLLLLPLPGVAAAQSDASIYGLVTDESGGVLPGVSVSVRSPALQTRERVVITDGSGEYRVTPLPIGTYEVEYTLSGFRTVSRQAVRLSVGFAARLDVTMSVGDLQETITVTGASPVVDTRQTEAAIVLSRENLELTPTARQGLITLINQAPGVRGRIDVGGGSLNQEPAISSFGQPGVPEARLEGVVTRFAAYWNYLSIEETQVTTVGNSAESETRGAHLNAIVKSGGNQFTGSAGFSLGGRIQSNNVTPELASQGIGVGADLRFRDDFNSELGGRILPDKLWFYTAGRHIRQETAILDGRVKPGTSDPVTNDQQANFYTTKLTYQLSSSNRIIGFYAWAQKRNGSPINRFTAWESRFDQRNNQDLGKGEWQRVIGDWLTTSLQFGYWGHAKGRIRNVPHSNSVSRNDIVTRELSGVQMRSGLRNWENTSDTRFKATIFRPDLFVGDHEFRAGAAHTYDDFGAEYPISSDLPPFNYSLRLASGAPIEMRVYNYPNTPRVVTNYLAFFVQDRWQVGRRLTLNLGIRRARDEAYAPEKCRDAARPPGHLAFPAGCYSEVGFPTRNVWDPRLNFAFDVTGDGRTVLKGGWGNYSYRNHHEDIVNLDADFPGFADYRWRDLNGNADYDPGEVDLNPNGPDFITQSVNQGVANPDLIVPTSDELMLSVEREVVPNLGVRVLGVHSISRDNYRVANAARPYSAYNVPVTNLDPGLDGRVGTADDPGVTFTYWEYSPELAAPAFVRPMFINDPSIDQTFTSIEVGLIRRYANRWHLSGSYRATKKNVPLFPGNLISEIVSLVLNADHNPNTEINTSDRTWEWNGYVSGGYDLPLDVRFGANYHFRSGRPSARQVLFRGGRTIPSLLLNVEPYGSRRFPHIQLLDLRFEKQVSLTQNKRIAVRWNVYNLLNSGTATGLDQRSGPTFGLVETILEPRIMELSATLTF